jgi:hypothetical protein
VGFVGERCEKGTGYLKFTLATDFTDFTDFFLPRKGAKGAKEVLTMKDLKNMKEKKLSADFAESADGASGEPRGDLVWIKTGCVLSEQASSGTAGFDPATSSPGEGAGCYLAARRRKRQRAGGNRQEA